MHTNEWIDYNDYALKITGLEPRKIDRLGRSWIESNNMIYLYNDSDLVEGGLGLLKDLYWDRLKHLTKWKILIEQLCIVQEVHLY